VVCFAVFFKLPKVNNRPKGENLPNLVTLLEMVLSAWPWHPTRYVTGKAGKNLANYYFFFYIHWWDKFEETSTMYLLQKFTYLPVQ
jgi:hypothetical protein